jgi:peroxiredoxin
MRRLVPISLILFAGFTTHKTKEPVIGRTAPDFTTRDTRGATQHLAAYRRRWVVLEWFSHACPYTAKQYATGNMQRLQKTYTAKGVVWLSIVSSATGHEGFTTNARANELTAEKGAAPSAVIRDTSGTIGHLYDARNTPQLFVIDPQGTLVYGGAIDDKRTSDTADVAKAHNYVSAALDESLAGKPVSVALTQPYGCTVQYSNPNNP